MRALGPMVLALVLGVEVGAQAQRELSFQGRLEEGGQPITAATDVTLRVYDAPTSGNLVLSETDNVTPDDAGTFVATLGDTASFDPAALAQPLYVEVEVAGGGGVRDNLRQNIVYVEAVPGDPVASGDRLAAALSAITSNSASNPFLVRLGPGEFRRLIWLETKEGVDLEGAGPERTRLSSPNDFGTLWVEHDVSIRNLSIENTASVSSCLGVIVGGTEAELRDVRILAAAGGPVATTGLDVRSASPTLVDVAIEVQGFSGGSTRGVLLTGGGTFTMATSQVEVAGDSSQPSYALDASGSGEVYVSASSLVEGSGSGSTSAAVSMLAPAGTLRVKASHLLSFGAGMVLSGGTLEATGSRFQAGGSPGLELTGGSATLTGCHLEGSEGADMASVGESLRLVGCNLAGAVRGGRVTAGTLEVHGGRLQGTSGAGVAATGSGAVARGQGAQLSGVQGANITSSGALFLAHSIADGGVATATGGSASCFESTNADFSAGGGLVCP